MTRVRKLRRCTVILAGLTAIVPTIGGCSYRKELAEAVTTGVVNAVSILVTEAIAAAVRP